MGGAPERNKNSKKIEVRLHLFLVNVVSLKYIGMIYINVGEMCFIPMDVHNEMFNGVHQLRCQHLSPVVSIFSTSSGFYPPFFIKHGMLSLSRSISL